MLRYQQFISCSVWNNHLLSSCLFTKAMREAVFPGNTAETNSRKFPHSKIPDCAAVLKNVFFICLTWEKPLQGPTTAVSRYPGPTDLLPWHLPLTFCCMCHLSAIFASELSYEPLEEKKRKKEKTPIPYSSVFRTPHLIFLLRNIVSVPCWGVGWDKLSVQQELFSHFHLYHYTASCPDCWGYLRKEIQLLLPLSLKERNWHNSKLSFRILLRTLVFTGRNYCLLKRISE